MYRTPDSSEVVVDVWAGVFETLSVSHFASFWQELGFPRSPDDELRVIAQNFVLCYYTYLQQPIPEQPSIVLLDNFDSKDSLVTLWNNTFSHLRRIGFANTAYNWGKQTYCNYSGQNNQIIQELDWDALLTDWTHNPTADGFLPLPLPSQAKTSLQLIIMEYDKKSRQLRRQIEDLKQSQQNKWEEFAFQVLNIGSWISLQAQFMMRVRKWDAIFEFLLAEEIKVLEQWGWQQFEKIGISSRVPLVHFHL